MNIQSHDNLVNYYQKAHEAAGARDSSRRVADLNESFSGSDPGKITNGDAGQQSQKQQMTLGNSDSANYMYPFNRVINPNNFDLAHFSSLSLENETGRRGRENLKVVGAGIA